MMGLTYKKAGVDISKAEEFVRSIKDFLENKGVSAFGCLYDFSKKVKLYKEPVLVSSSDGVGTKLKIAQTLGIHHSVGIDLVAMNVNDIVCMGAEPLFFLDYIACGKLNPKILREVIKGINRGLKEAGCLFLGGETAEMPGMYRKEEYDLAGFSVGVGEKKKIIDGKKVREGDIVIGLASSGLHSNGFSLVRKVFSEREIKEYAQELLRPTRIYVRPVLSLLSAFNSQLSTIKGIAHNTGGAFYNKLTKILPPGFSFRIYKNSWRVPKIFRVIQEKGRLPEKEMFSTFNMGIGMILIVEKRLSQKIVDFLRRMKLKANIIGEVLKGQKERIILV